MSKCEKPKWQSIDHFFTKSVPSTQLPDDPDNQHTVHVDEEASSEESSNVAFPQEIETESSSTVAAHPNT